jgi:hypothetical protein
MSIRRAALTGASTLIVTAGLLSALGTAGVSAAARRPAAGAHRPVPNEVTGLAGWGSAASKRVTGQIFAARTSLAARGIELTRWGPDPATGKVKVYLTRYTSAARRALITRFGPDVIVARHSMPLPSRQGRTNDTSPFSGGDRIIVGGTEACTSGPTVIGNGSGSTFMLTAGHCGAVNATVKTHGVTMGHVVNVRFCDGCIDSEFVSGNYSPTAFGGPPTGSQPLWQEDGSLFPQPNKGAASQVTMDGASTGEVRGATVVAVNQNVTFSDGITTRFVTAATKGGSAFCQLGDSGGPWFQHEGNTAAVKIVGTHLGADANTCYYVQIDAITTFFNVHVP